MTHCRKSFCLRLTKDFDVIKIKTRPELLKEKQEVNLETQIDPENMTIHNILYTVNNLKAPRDWYVKIPRLFIIIIENINCWVSSQDGN